jgi:hypothetical protein
MMLTPDKTSNLRYLEHEARKIREGTKTVSLVEGPFHGQTARIASYFKHYATTVPKSVAESYRPFQVDGVPDVPEMLRFVAVYEPANSDRFVFERIEAWKKTENGTFPQAFERV